MAGIKTKTSTSEKHEFPSGGGQMGELMRTKNWSVTSIGNPDKWPQSLLTTLNIILNCKFPMFLWWGPELICFYNDAYRPSLGEKGKHPGILGMPAKEAWPEIWDTIKPLIDQVLGGGEATWNEDQLIPIFRNGKIEDAYWTFSYSPVIDEPGKVAGVLVTCSETTDKIHTYKRLEENNDQLEFAIAAAELGTWDYNPATNKFTCNNRLKQWFGLPMETELDLALAINAIAEKDRERITTDIRRSLEFSSGGNFENEYTIVHPVTKKETIVQARGKAWFSNEQVVYRFNGTLQDVTEQAMTLKQTAESEKEFRQLADSLPELVWTTDNKGKQIFASKRWKEFTGQDPYDETTFEKMVHPDDIENIIQIWSSCLVSGNTYKTQARLKSSEGDYQWFYVNGEPVKNAKGKIEKWIGAFTNLHEQKKAEEELINALHKIEESEKRFRNVANSAPVFIWMAGSDKQRYFFNTAWMDFTGRSPGQEKGDGWIEGVHPEDREKCFRLYGEAFSKQQGYQMEYRLRRYDGEYRWISARGVPRFSTSGIFEGFIGACMDIHEQVIAQKKLKEDEERLNIIVSASDLGTWELNLNTMEVIHSGRYIEIFGYDNNTHLSHTEILEHLHPDDLPKRKTAFENAIATGVLYYESRVIAKDKSIRWVENKGKVFYDEQNQAHKIIGTTRDTTEEKNYAQQLVDREQKFRLLADSMPQFVWTGDAEGNLNYFSRAVYEYSGLSHEQMGKDGWMQIVHPDDREENMRVWNHSINSGTDFIFEHRFGKYDGAYRWQLSRAIPQRDAAGNIQMWVGTSTDIQEIKEQDQQKDYFISMASHELKTPITSIKGYVQILQSTYEKNEDPFLKSSLKVIDKQITTLTSLISDLLDVSKIKSGNLVLNKEDFEITTLVQEVIAEIKHINPDYTINFLHSNTVTVYADKGRIGQVLINFLTNAVKYSPQSKTINVDSFIEDDYVGVSVEDSGIGISKIDQEKIFERFYRVEGKNEKTFPGFGIGLFIASEIIQRHEGKVGVKSEPGKGSRFYFSIPFTK